MRRLSGDLTFQRLQNINKCHLWVDNPFKKRNLFKMIFFSRSGGYPVLYRVLHIFNPSTVQDLGALTGCSRVYMECILYVFLQKSHKSLGTPSLQRHQLPSEEDKKDIVSSPCSQQIQCTIYRGSNICNPPEYITLQNIPLSLCMIWPLLYLTLKSSFHTVF